MDNIAGFLNTITKPRYEEDIVDRLNYAYTGWLLIAFAITLSGKGYVGAPLNCWLPAQFKGGWEQYVHDYCFVENTYWLPFNETIPENHAHRDEKMLNYYQWVPFVLALMAMMFYLPHMLWRTLNFLSGLSVRSVISMADSATSSTFDKRENIVKLVAGHIRESLKVQNSVATPGLSSGWYIVIMYLLTKVLFIVNIIAQFYILLSFLGTEFNFWGFTHLDGLAAERDDWTTTGFFPRVTMCDFDVRVLGNVQRFTAQCVLTINMFNEKIFLFIWWWFLLVAIVTILSFFHWVIISFLPSYRQDFIRKMLNTHGLPQADNEGKIDEFVQDFVRPDGVFVLRLMTSNVGDLVTSRVVVELWMAYLKERKRRMGYGGFGNRGPYTPDNSGEIDPIDL